MTAKVVLPLRDHKGVVAFHSKDQGGGKRRGEGIVNERAEARVGRTNGE